MPLLRYLPLSLAFGILLVMAVESSRRPGAASAAPFHAAAAEAVRAIPLQFGGWSGADVAVPPAAQALLKPNAILSRVYSNVSSGEQVNVAVVQCRDARDMGGHYPPICYPGQGWTPKNPGIAVPLRLGSGAVTAMRYEFGRLAFDGDRTLVIYNFFAVPGGGILTDMGQIRRFAADYTARPFGAAQVQIAMSSSRSLPEEAPVVEEIIAALEPALRTLSDANWREK